MSSPYVFEVTRADGFIAPGGVNVVGFRERSGTAFTHRILPRPSVGVVIDCTTGSITAGPMRSTGGPAPSGVVGGMTPVDGQVCAARLDCLEIQFSPLVAGAYLDVAPVELDSPFLSLDDVWGPPAQSLKGQLLESHDWESRFSAVGQLLMAVRREQHRVDPEIADAWRLIVATGGRVPVARLADRYGWSRTRFWRRFRAQVGLSPKRATRVVRFDRALRLVSAGRPLAVVATETGFADQPHLNREFRELASTTPTSLLREPIWRSPMSWTSPRGSGPAVSSDQPARGAQKSKTPDMGSRHDGEGHPRSATSSPGSRRVTSAGRRGPAVPLGIPRAAGRAR
ncbi:helix-turn-helix domain-containing protein [Intrasporangium sp. DVR]|uniref:helix-turn-helix domain-containing protein n=1 Tax=Intrasporangium sp. DVR TaxID=3127867 RepID=UPI00313A5C30